jgi:hypothetical protein
MAAGDSFFDAPYVPDATHYASDSCEWGDLALE